MRFISGFPGMGVILRGFLRDFPDFLDGLCCWLDCASELSAHDACAQRPPVGASARVVSLPLTSSQYVLSGVCPGAIAAGHTRRNNNRYRRRARIEATQEREARSMEGRYSMFTTQ